MVQQARQSSEAIPVTFIPSPQDKKSSHKGGKIHFRSQRGYFQRWRSGLNALLIALFLLLPFIDWQGR